MGIPANAGTCMTIIQLAELKKEFCDDGKDTSSEQNRVFCAITREINKRITKLIKQWGSIANYAFRTGIQLFQQVGSRVRRAARAAMRRIRRSQGELANQGIANVGGAAPAE